MFRYNRLLKLRCCYDEGYFIICQQFTVQIREKTDIGSDKMSFKFWSYCDAHLVHTDLLRFVKYMVNSFINTVHWFKYDGLSNGEMLFQQWLAGDRYAMMFQ